MYFVVFEGLDGSGKSSLMTALQSDLEAKKITYIRTREPGGTPLGDQLRHLILRKDGPAPTTRTELLLYEASRSQHVDEVIKPTLQKKHWVLCDRFAASSVAFQAGGRAITEEWVHVLNSFATGGLKPDLTVLLDLSVEESRKRRQQRELATGEKEDRIEAEADEFHQRVRASFLKQAKEDPGTWLVLDASNSPEYLIEQLRGEIKRRGWLA